MSRGGISATRLVFRTVPFNASPFNASGNESWSERAVRRLGLESTLRPQGRPKKSKNGS